MSHSHVITVLLGVGVLGVLLVAIWLLESSPEAEHEERHAHDLFE